MKKAFTFGVIILLVLGFGFYLYSISPKEQAKLSSSSLNEANIAPVSTPRPIEDSDHILGNPGSKNTLIVYEDFQCPYCKNYYPTVESFPSQLKDTRVVFRHFPLIHNHANALVAAYAAEAAGAQGKFWEMYKSLYDEQDNWANLSNPLDKFAQIAQSVGVQNIDQFKSDITSEKYKSLVEKDYREAMGLNLPGTPSIVFNDKIIQDPQLNSLKVEVEPLYKQ